MNYLPFGQQFPGYNAPEFLPPHGSPADMCYPQNHPHFNFPEYAIPKSSTNKSKTYHKHKRKNDSRKRQSEEYYQSKSKNNDYLEEKRSVSSEAKAGQKAVTEQRDQVSKTGDIEKKCSNEVELKVTILNKKDNLNCSEKNEEDANPIVDCKVVDDNVFSVDMSSGPGNVVEADNSSTEKKEVLTELCNTVDKQKQSDSSVKIEGHDDDLADSKTWTVISKESEAYVHVGSDGSAHSLPSSPDKVDEAEVQELIATDVVPTNEVEAPSNVSSAAESEVAREKTICAEESQSLKKVEVKSSSDASKQQEPVEKVTDVNSNEKQESNDQISKEIPKNKKAVPQNVKKINQSADAAKVKHSSTGGSEQDGDKEIDALSESGLSTVSSSSVRSCMSLPQNPLARSTSWADLVRKGQSKSPVAPLTTARKISANPRYDSTPSRYLSHRKPPQLQSTDKVKPTKRVVVKKPKESHVSEDGWSVSSGKSRVKTIPNSKKVGPKVASPQLSLRSNAKAESTLLKTASKSLDSLIKEPSDKTRTVNRSLRNKPTCATSKPTKKVESVKKEKVEKEPIKSSNPSTARLNTAKSKKAPNPKVKSVKVISKAPQESDSKSVDKTCNQSSCSKTIHKSSSDTTASKTEEISCIKDSVKKSANKKNSEASKDLNSPKVVNKKDKKPNTKVCEQKQNQEPKIAAETSIPDEKEETENLTKRSETVKEILPPNGDDENIDPDMPQKLTRSVSDVTKQSVKSTKSVQTEFDRFDNQVGILAVPTTDVSYFKNYLSSEVCYYTSHKNNCREK